MNPEHIETLILLAEDIRWLLFFLLAFLVCKSLAEARTKKKENTLDKPD